MQLGDLTGRLLIFGGPYSNLSATRAMWQTANRLGIAADQVVCTGDTVAYCAEPNETVATLRDWGCRVVMGNCEEALAEQSADCGCGFESGSACSTLADAWYRFSVARLSAEHRSWMRDLPRALRFGFDGQRCLVVHGSVEHINEFVFESGPVASKRRQLGVAQADVVIGGHCGLPFGQCLSPGYWLNSGAIGMPANDGTPDGWYLLLSPTPDGIEASWHRLAYDWRGSRDAMRAAGISLPYAETLDTGLWPSLDVLPETERTRTGRALSIGSMLIDNTR